jgi:hypothetical protein
MADIRDDIGRVGQFQDAGIEKLSSMLNATVKIVKQISDKASVSEKDYEELSKSLEELGDDLKENSESSKKFVDEVKEAIKSVEKSRKSGKGGKKEKGDFVGAMKEHTKILEMILDEQKKFVGASTQAGKVAAGPIGSIKNSFSGMTGTMGKKANGSLELVVDSVKIDPIVAQESKKVGEEITKNINDGLQIGSNKEIASWLTGISTALMGGKADFIQALFTGSITDATQFQAQMRLIAFETKGITGDLREMQSEFSDLGRVAAETGKNISVLQTAYMSNLKKGFKSNKDGLKVMKSGLFLSTMIGSEAQQTADLFGDWHRNLALSSSEMGELARGMRNIALSTGVSGDELLGAMKSSEGILKNLRDQGNLTADVSNSVIEMMAEAKKTGFGESTNKVLSAMSSTGSIMDADAPTQSLIYTISNRMGGNATDSVLSGTFMKDRENLTGFSNELMGLVGNLSDGAIKSLEDFDKLSDAQKKDLALRLRGYGLTIGQAESLISTTKKAGMGLAGNLEELNKIESSKFSTDSEKQLAKKQKAEKYLGASLNYLSAIGDEAKDKNLSDALKDSAASSDFKNKKQDFTAMAGAMTSEMKSAYGIGGTSEQMSQQLSSLDPQKAAELNALILGDQLNKMASEQGVSLEKDYAKEIKTALASGDNAQYRSLVEEAQTKASEIAVGKKAASTPEEEMVLSLNKLNETIRGYTSSFVRGMTDYIGSMGLLLIQVGIMSAALYYMTKPISSLTNLMGGLFPKGGLKGMFSKIAPEGGIKGLLGRTDELGDAMKGGLIKGIEDVGKKGNIVFKQMGNGINSFGKKLKGSLSSSVGVFKNARAPSTASKMMDIAEYRKFRKKGMAPVDAKKAVEKMGGFSKGKGIFSSLKDAGDEFIKGMTGKVGKLSGVIDSVANSKVVKTIKGSFDSLFSSFAKGKSAFKFMRSGSGKKGLFSALTVGFDQFSSSLTGGIRPFNKITSIFSSFIDGIKNFKLSNLKSIPGILKGGAIGLFKGVKNVMSGGVGGLVKGFGPLFKGGMKGIATGLRGALAGGTLGMSQIIFGAIDMVFGAVSGFQNTGKNFESVMKAMGKSTKDMTWGMYASSTIAGGLVGILDGLTFGMLRLTGVADFLEQTLSLVFYAFFSVIEGFISGVMVAVDMVKPALKSLYESFAGLGKALLGLFNAVASIFGAGEAKNAGEAFAMLYSVLKPIGKAIGMIVGVPLGAILWTLVKVIGVVVNAVTLLVNIFTGLVKAIVAPFKWMWNILVGNSIVPDLCTAIVGLFGKMALSVIKGLGSFVFKAAKFFLKLPFKIMGGLIKTFIKTPLKIFGKTMNLLSGGLFNKGLSMMSRNVGDFFGSFKNYLVDFSTGAFKQGYRFLNLLSGGWLDKAIKGITSLGSTIVSLVDDFLVKPLTNAFSTIAERAAQFFKPLTNFVSNMTTKAGQFIKPVTDGVSKMASVVSNKVNQNLIKPISNMTTKAGQFVKPVTDGVSKMASVASNKVNQNLIKPISNAASRVMPGGSAAGATSKAASVADDAAKAVVSSADDIAKAAPKALGFLGKASGFVGMAAKKLPVVGPMLDFGIRKAMGQDTAQAAVGAGGGLAGGLAGAAIGTMILPVIGTAVGGLIGSLAGSWFADTAYDAATGKKPDATVAAKGASDSVGKASAGVSTPVGHHAVPVLKPNENADVGAVQPVHLRDITGSILRERAGTSGTGKVQSDELSRIEDASVRQVDELEQIRQGISEMVALLRPKGNVVGGTGDSMPGGTKDPRRPMHAAKFGKMKYGRAGGNANRSVVNNGEV